MTARIEAAPKVTEFSVTVVACVPASACTSAWSYVGGRIALQADPEND